MHACADSLFASSARKPDACEQHAQSEEWKNAYRCDTITATAARSELFAISAHRRLSGAGRAYAG